MLYTALAVVDEDAEKWALLQGVAEGSVTDAQEAWTEVLSSWDLESDNSRAELETIGQDALGQAITYLEGSLAEHIDPTWMSEQLRTFQATFTLESLLP